VSAEHLAPWEPILRERLGCEIHLDLIPYARDSREQVELLRVMAEHVAAGDQVHLDVTHGFRHLPMLAILAALHLRSVRAAAIAGIWYGAWDPDTGEAPVHDLSGLLQIADWLQALHTYDKDGDYSVFCDLLATTASASSESLRQAAFHEKTNHVGQARAPLRKFRQGFEAAPADPLLQLFADELRSRTAWVDQQSLTERQYELALHFLEHGDYLRAAILGFESLITRLVQASPQSLQPLNQTHRDGIKRDWDEAIRRQGQQRSETQQAYLDLREIRNALAHGSLSSFGHIQTALASEVNLNQALRKAIALAHQGAAS
jgi:CRISPR-associated DxTHG motif protein